METKSKIEVLLRGFDVNVVHSSFNLCEKYKNLIKKTETNLKIFEKMSTGRRIKSYDDVINNSNVSFKGYDNDSGYISQAAAESNSSVETSENRFIEAMTSTAGSIYVNEDTLLEKPHIPPKHTGQVEENDDNYQEFDHLFFMSSIVAPTLESSVTSQNTNFSGFEGDESEVSGVIPVATPLKVSSKVLNNTEDIANCSISQNGKDLNKENDQNYLNAKNNLKHIKPVCENDCVDDKNLNLIENSKNAYNEQAIVMDVSANDMSFESFYSRLCGLYTRSDFPADNFSKICINPNNLHNFDDSGEEKEQRNASFNSPYKSFYMELETVPKKSSVEFTNATSCSFQSSDTVFTNTACKSSYIELEGINKKTTIIACDHTDVTTSVIHNSKIKQSHDASSGKEQHLNNQKATLTLLKQYNNPISPELFSDEESLEQFSYNESFALIQKACEEKYTTKNDRKLLKRARQSLGTVLPPPSFTVVQMSVNEILQRINDNKHLFDINSNKDLVDNCDKVKQSVNSNNLTHDYAKESLLVTCKREDFDPADWPNIIHFRYHGLHYNRSKISEDFEHLCLKYAERYVGAETQSTCSTFATDISSPSKRKYKFKRAAKSPGKRLSHLARRRITFSFQNNDVAPPPPSNCSFIGARTRQIMVDVRKYELSSRRRSPRKKSPRKTPGKSPRRRPNTPNSSSKKHFSMKLKPNEEDTSSSIASTSSSRASAHKRALFQSPDKGETTNGLLQLFGSSMSNESSQSAKRRTPRRALFHSPLKSSPSKMSISSLYPAKRKLTPKRALFMSPEKSPSKRINNCDKKRKRTDSESDQLTKISRSMSSELKPSNESGSQSRTFTKSQNTTSGFQTQDIVAHRKKKMLWAVAEALRSRNIDMKHKDFKVYASVLARLIRHFLPSFFTNGPRPEGSSTESMLRVARQHVFAVTKGQTAEEIIKEAQSKVRVAKPSGYVGLYKVDKPADFSLRNKENVLQDRANIISSERLQSEASYLNKNNRGVERIRRVIDFGDEEEVKNESSR